MNDPLIVAVTGASGFIGSRVVQRLRTEGRPVRTLGRSLDPTALDGCTAVIHLAGEPVAQRWTADVKQRIRRSRVEGTRHLVEAMRRAANPPSTLICASAIGYYGDRGEEVLTEASPRGTGFLPEACVEWEAAAREAERVGARVTSLRFGIVLGQGGAVRKMLTPFRLGLGGPIGSGHQWMSWIHIDDAVELIMFALDEERVAGPFNAVAPEPVRNSEFTKALAAAVHRPAIVPVPVFGLKLLFGEMASVMIASLRVIPEAAIRAGFRFRYDRIRPALESAVHE